MRFVSLALLAACASAPPPAPPAPVVASAPRPEPFPPAELPEPPGDLPAGPAAPPVLLRNATVMTAAGKVFAPGHVLIKDGVIKDVGAGPGDASGASVVDVGGGFITPGIIDAHSHMGVYPLPGTDGNSDGNESVKPLTAYVSSQDAFWPQDPSLTRAVASGVTTIQVLPGSANLIGGRSFVAKLKLGRSAREMRFPGAPEGLKMACGENPKRNYAERGGPKTRMGNIAGFRKAFQDATEYRRKWAKYRRDLELWKAKLAHAKTKDADPKAKHDEEPPPIDPPEQPARDFELETLSDVLDGKILVHNHCYRADEMSLMLDLAKEFRFKIRAFHHALEAYKIRDRLAAEGVAVATWADWWGFKMEGYDGVPENAALVSEAGGRAIIHSDSETELRHLNQEAAKAMAAGQRIGVKVDENEALRWITANPAWALGVDDKTGTLTEGKMGDVVMWDRDPFSVYARAMKVYIDGALVFDRATSTTQRTDFEIGTGVQP
jgi:imidazolonepropionase-like amidohydrolase